MNKTTILGARILPTAILCLIPLAAIAAGKPVPGNLLSDMQQFVETPAVPGYEQVLSSAIAQRLAAYSPKTDSLGDLVVRWAAARPTAC